MAPRFTMSPMGHLDRHWSFVKLIDRVSSRPVFDLAAGKEQLTELVS